MELQSEKKNDGLRVVEFKKSRVVTFGASRYLLLFFNDVLVTNVSDANTYN